MPESTFYAVENDGIITITQNTCRSDSAAPIKITATQSHALHTSRESAEIKELMKKCAQAGFNLAKKG